MSEPDVGQAPVWQDAISTTRLASACTTDVLDCMQDIALDGIGQAQHELTLGTQPPSFGILEEHHVQTSFAEEGQLRSFSGSCLRDGFQAWYGAERYNLRSEEQVVRFLRSRLRLMSVIAGCRLAATLWDLSCLHRATSNSRSAGLTPMSGLLVSAAATWRTRAWS